MKRLNNMRILFSILSIIYIASIFLMADSPVVSDLAPFNPYSLLHIPLYGILTILLIFSCVPLTFKNKVLNSPNDLNDANDPKVPNDLSHKRLVIAGFIALGVAISDEIHQAYIPSREASINDIFLDLVGIFLAMLLIVKLYKNQIILKTHLIKSATK
jgi:hypothetical protein